MVTTTDTRQKPPTVYEYGYLDCKALRYKGVSWRKLGERYGRHHSTINERYNRDTEKERINTTANRINKKNSKINSVNLRGHRNSNRQPISRTEDKLEYHNNLTLEEVRRIKYGNLEPTNWVSPLSDLEWCQRYLGMNRFRWGEPYINSTFEVLRSYDKTNLRLWRGAGKTTMWLGSNLRRFNEIPIPRLNICSPKRVRILFRAIRNPLLRNPLIRRDYGDIIDVDDGSVQASRTDKMIWYSDDIDYDHTDPGFRVASREDDVIGSRPAEIHYEDPTQRESESGVVKLKEWHGEVMKPMLSLEKGLHVRETMTSTSKGDEDFGAFLITQGWNYLRYKSVELLEGEFPKKEDVLWDYFKSESGEIARKVKGITHRGKYKLTNPQMDLDKLLEIAALDYPTFMSQYQNQYVSRTGVYFNVDYWIERDQIDCGTCMIKHHPWVHEQGVQYYCAIDPARGLSDGADNTAIIVVAILNGIGMIVDGFVGKTTDIVKEYDYFYSTYNLVWTLVEKTFAQIDMNRFNRYRGIIPYTDTAPRAKYMRIDAMRSYFNDGLIQILKQDSDQDRIKGKPYAFLYNEYRSYNQTPSTTTRKDDALDSTSMIIQLAGQYLVKYMETRTDWSQTGDFHLTAEG